MKQMKLLKKSGSLVIVLILTVLVFGNFNYVNASTNATNSTGSTRTTYSQSKLFPSIGNGWETVEVYAVYTENYKYDNPYTTTYNHRVIYYRVNITNNNSDIENDCTMFTNSRYYDSSNNLLSTHWLNTPETAIFPGGSYVNGNMANYDSVELYNQAGVTARLGFTINPSGWVPWSDTISMGLNRAISTASSDSNKSTTNESNLFYMLGKLEGERLNYQSAQYTDNLKNALEIETSSKNLSSLVAEYELIGYSSEEATALVQKNIESKKYTYDEAVANGCNVDDATVNNAINEFRNKIKSADNYSDFLSFISGTGMSEDDYWNIQFSLFKINETIKMYQEKSK